MLQHVLTVYNRPMKAVPFKMKMSNLLELVCETLEYVDHEVISHIFVLQKYLTIKNDIDTNFTNKIRIYLKIRNFVRLRSQIYVQFPHIGMT